MDDAERLALRQLEKLLEDYPNHTLDVEGLILDYAGRSGASVDSILDLNPRIYASLFTGQERERGRRLLRALVADPESRGALVVRCGSKYGEITEMIREGSAVVRPNVDSQKLLANPEEVLGYRVQAVIWHLSDVHFGKFNKVQADARELAFLLAKLAAEYGNVRPNTVVVSGDVSSMAAPGEFADFKTFCSVLSSALWDGPHPERVLVVPGNHDVTWLDDGSADRMAAFAKAFDTDDVCITPFGVSKAEFGGGKVTVTRVNPSPASVPPFALVRDNETATEFVLLVSGYFSGEIPAKIREVLHGVSGSEEELHSLLRLDQGALNQEYLYRIAQAMEPRPSPAFGVIHHNPIQYGVETCQNNLAPQLMETLWRKHVRILLHGHVHLSESAARHRPVTPGEAYPIPAPTLSSIPTAGSGRGLNIHFAGPCSADGRNVDTLVWPFAESMGLNAANASWRYRFVLRDNQLSVEHMQQ